MPKMTLRISDNSISGYREFFCSFVTCFLYLRNIYKEQSTSKVLV